MDECKGSECVNRVHILVGLVNERVGRNVMKFEDYHCVGTSSSEE